ncbi:MAG: hypothetical protein H7A23_16765 [Leptospiraceae bacterium]|nr:hypothetical protein [Leptospiraceae bacterium]MCP5496199.1 hypothetical protein [Leptospiraceae bacterium]
MAYNKFKLKDLKIKFGIENSSRHFLPQELLPFVPSQKVLSELADAEGVALATEKAKSEHIITPTIKELRRRNLEKFSYFSGYEFNVDKKQGLNGYCDFIFSAKPHKIEIENPIFCFVEAKKDDIDGWFGQCGAEMYAAQLYNEREGNPRKVIYGCVTNAFSWCFLKLEDKNLFIDPNYIPLTFSEPHRVLEVLQWILDDSLQQN